MDSTGFMEAEAVIDPGIELIAGLAAPASVLWHVSLTSPSSCVFHYGRWPLAEKLRDAQVLLTESHLVLFYYDRWPLLPNCYANASDRHFVINQSHIPPFTMTYSIYMDRILCSGATQAPSVYRNQRISPGRGVVPPNGGVSQPINRDSEDGIMYKCTMSVP